MAQEPLSFNQPRWDHISEYNDHRSLSPWLFHFLIILLLYLYWNRTNIIMQIWIITIGYWIPYKNGNALIDFHSIPTQSIWQAGWVVVIDVDACICFCFIWFIVFESINYWNIFYYCETVANGPEMFQLIFDFNLFVCM